MAKRPRVALLAGDTIGWRERMMRGIASYSHDHGPWHVYSAPEGVEDSLIFSRSYRWDGVITIVGGRRFAKRLRSLGVPAVSIGSCRLFGPTIPRVKVDDEKLARLAFRHLHAMGIRRFAYCGLFTRRAAEDRGAAFARVVSSQGFECFSYLESTRLKPVASWQSRQRDLARWLAQLEKPVGLLAWNPDIALHVIEACSRAEVRVPGDIAVLSGDEDRSKCELSKPTISAIEIPAAQIGFEAAALLDRLMAGEPPPREPIQVEPSGKLTIRESTDITDQAESAVYRAVNFIREHACEPISVGEVADNLVMSPRSLERNFRKVLGRSPQEEIRRARIEAAKKLLLETDWPVEKVAQAAGLTTGPYLHRVFVREMGLTPGDFRRRSRID
jgi:LacI family transcriptional regulator